MKKIEKEKLPSRHVSVGPKSSPHRSYYYAMGMSEKEIYQFLKTKYGDWILYDPVLNQKTYILWLLPLLLFLIGGAIIFKNLKIKKN